MSGDFRKGPATIMAKRGIFFQFSLNPKTERDRKIIAWIESIPRWHRSKSVKDLLYRFLCGTLHSPPELPKGTPRKAAEMTRNLMKSIKDKSSTRL